MTSAEKWDAKYQQMDPSLPVPPAWLIQHHAALLPLKGKALDLASGLGGNARFMAQCGLKVDAWDISDVALTHLNNWAALNQMPIQPLLTDLDQMILPYQQYDIITISYYLNRTLWQPLIDALKPGGKLFVQTFLAPAQDQGPNTPSFYLKPGELTQSLASLTCLVQGEGWLTSNSNRQRQAWFIGQKP